MSALKRPLVKRRGRAAAAPAQKEPPLREKAYGILRDQIVDGQLSPGRKLVEAPLCAAFGISRTPLREALLRLEREGLVCSDHDKGYAVATLSEGEARETYPILSALECLALRRSAPLCFGLAGPLDAVNAELRACADARGRIALDNRWHDLLISRSANVRLHATIAGLRRSIYRYETIYMAADDLVDESVKQHATIAGALRRRDLGAAIETLDLNNTCGLDALVLKIARG
jgi:DNA-binding GntR family transcriptional regulator